MPRPADWPDGYQVTGYWWPARPAGWNPPPDLERFLDSGPSPVFLGFGSLTPEDTGELIELAASASGRAGVRLVIQAGQAGPPSAGRSPGDSIVVGDVPHVGDQPFWAARLAALGAGPPPIPRSQLSVPVLAAAIRDAVARPSYRTQAEAMSRRLATEDGAAPVISMLARLGNS